MGGSARSRNSIGTIYTSLFPSVAPPIHEEYGRWNILSQTMPQACQVRTRLGPKRLPTTACTWPPRLLVPPQVWLVGRRAFHKGLFRAMQASIPGFLEARKIALPSASPVTVDLAEEEILCVFYTLNTSQLEPATSQVLMRLCCVQCGTQLLQSCPTLCNPMNCSPPGSSSRGILPARIPEWVAMTSSKGSSQTRDWTHVSWRAGGFFTCWAIRKPIHEISSYHVGYWVYTHFRNKGSKKAGNFSQSHTASNW